MLRLLIGLASALAATCAFAQSPHPRLDLHGDRLPDGAIARLGTLRLRHSAAISALAYSAGGKELVSAANDGTVTLWEAETGKELRRFAGPRADIHALAIAPDGKTVAAAGSNGLIVWEAASGKQLHKFDKSTFSSVSISPDGKTLAGGTHAGIYLWDLKTGEQLLLIEANTGREQQTVGLAFAPDGKTIASVQIEQQRRSAECHVQLWETATGKEVRRLNEQVLLASRRFEQGYPRLAFAADGKALAVVAEAFSRIIYVWDPTTGKELRQLKLAGREFRGFAFSPDSKQLATSDQVGGITVWNLADGKVAKQIETKPGNTGALAFAPDGKRVATGGSNMIVCLWDPAAGKEVRPIDGHRSPILDVAIRPDGKQVVTAGNEPALRLWDADGKEVRSWKGHPKGVCAVAWQPDGKAVASSGYDGVISLWDPETAKELVNIDGRDRNAKCLAYSPDSKLLACGGEVGDITLRDARTGAEVRRFPAHDHWVSSLVFSPDGRLLASSSYDASVRLWNPLTGKLVRRLDIAGKAIWRVAFAGDSKTLATASEDGVIRLWETATGQERRRLEPALGQLPTLAFAPDGRLLATAGTEQKLRLWDPLTGAELKSFETGQAETTRLVFSTAGQTLVSVGSDTTGLIWGVGNLERKRAAKKLEAKAIESLWADLAGAEGAKAYQAIAGFALSPDQAVTWLGDNIQVSAAVNQERIVKLVADLDSRKFAEREKAYSELEKLGEAAAAEVRKALAGNPGLDLQRRLEKLLEQVDVQHLSGERLRTWRAIEVLEVIGTTEAKKVLQKIADGTPGARETEAAREALKRMSGK